MTGTKQVHCDRVRNHKYAIPLNLRRARIVPVDPRPVSKMQHIVEELVQLALKITTAKITTAKVGGAVIFRNVYYRIEATEYR